jgi:hypothetical protein
MRRWSLEHGMEIRCALGDGADDNRPSRSRSNGDGKRWRWEWAAGAGRAMADGWLLLSTLVYLRMRLD